MDTITFSLDRGEQSVRFGTQQPQAFTNLGHAFELAQEVVTDLLTGEFDSSWASLVMVVETDVRLRVEADGGSYILFISDSASGSSTSAGIKSLADAFDFMAYWAMENFE